MGRILFVLSSRRVHEQYHNKARREKHNGKEKECKKKAKARHIRKRKMTKCRQPQPESLKAGQRAGEGLEGLHRRSRESVVASYDMRDGNVHGKLILVWEVGVALCLVAWD